MNRMSPISAIKASTRSRYPGTRPFSESPEDRQRFFGRDREGEQLYLRVLSVSLLLQFAKSGLGKTSLLQASLFPRLRQKHFLPVLVRFNETDESPIDAVARSFRQACQKEQLEVPALRTEGLWDLLSTAFVWRGDLLLTPVLVLDQFEEVFTVRDALFRARLAEELGALATGVPPERLCSNEAGESEPRAPRPNVKIVISMREDYLGAVEEFSPAIPNLFHERLRLEPLSEEGAREAITNPAQLLAQEGEEPFWTPEFEYETPALDKMIEFLKGDAGVIEPFTLQLLCRKAESLAHDKGGASKKPVTLTLADFHDGRDFKQVLRSFYQEALGRLEQSLGPSARTNVEEMCEHGLLDREGRRLLLEEGQIHDQFGVDDKTLKVLLQERLVRRERRGESTFYEVSHDRLAESIYASRRNKLPKNEREQRQKEEALIRKTYRNVILTVIGVSLAVLLTSAYFLISERTINLATRISFGENDDIPLRDRLLATVDASRKSESLGAQLGLRLFGPKEGADETLRDILVRSPIFAGTTQAALDSAGGRMAYLSASSHPAPKLSKLFSLDLPKAVSKASDLNLVQANANANATEVPLGKLVGAKLRFSPTVGFIAPVSDKGDAGPLGIVVSPGSLSTESSGPDGLTDSCTNSPDRSPDQNQASGDSAKNSLLLVASNQAVKQVDLPLGNFLAGLPFPPQVDFANNSYRVFGWPFKGGLPTEVCILAFRAHQTDQPTPLLARATGDSGMIPSDLSLAADGKFPVRIDWQPDKREARRIPVLASDCNKFVFLGFPVGSGVQPNVVRPVLYAGDFFGPASSKEIDVSLPLGSGTASSVTISRGCATAVVRLSAGSASGDKVFLINLNEEREPGVLGDTSEYDIPVSLKGFLLPSWPLLWAALASAPLPGSNAMRVAWLLEKGLAVVDLPKGTKEAIPLLEAGAAGFAQRQGDENKKEESKVFLTGFPSSQSNTRLTLSRDGNFLLATSQKSFSSVPDFRLFDLRVPERRALLEKLSGEQLRDVACQVVDFLPPAGSPSGAMALLGDPKQICE